MLASTTQPRPADPAAKPDAAPSAHAGAKLPPTSCNVCHIPPAGTIERHGLKITHSEYLSYGARCESCHRNTTAVPVPIESGQCLECHNFGIERMTSAEDMHRTHMQGEHKIECFSCHGTIHHGPSAQAGSLDQFDCRKCHVDQHGVQRRTYLHDDQHPADAPDTTVSPMFLAHVDCTGCHIKQRPVSSKPYSGAMVAAAIPEACDRCHKPGFGGEMVPLWQKTTHSLFDAIEKDVKAVEGAAASNADAAAACTQVRKLLDRVRADGSWGVHNPRYTQQLLEQARTTLAPFKPKAAEGTP